MSSGLRAARKCLYCLLDVHIWVMRNCCDLFRKRRLKMVAHPFNHSTCLRGRGSQIWVRGQPDLQKEVQASQDYAEIQTLFQKIKTKKETEDKNHSLAPKSRDNVNIFHHLQELSYVYLQINLLPYTTANLSDVAFHIAKTTTPETAEITQQF